MYVLVHPDVLKIEKPYWYEITEKTKLAQYIEPGVKVRVGLHGRRVKGWVVEISEHLPQDSVDKSKIAPVIEFVSVGIAGHMIEISNELAKRYLISPVSFYRKCSPERNIDPKQLVSTSFIPGNSDLEKCILVDPRADRRELIESSISKSGSTLIISPDSHSKILNFLKGKQYDVVHYQHVGPNAKQSFIEAARRDKVIVGSRSALFAPSNDCRSIIILDDSYEQMQEERSPKWHVLDCARLFAGLTGSDLTLITSVPSVNSYKMKITDHRTKKHWPKVSVVDTRDNDPVIGIFSKEVTDCVNKSINLKTDSVIVLNALVSAKLLVCKTCDSVSTCEVCGHSMSYDSKSDKPLFCSICKETKIEICGVCSGTKFKKYRKGVQSLVDESSKVFPTANIIEITSKQNSQEIASRISTDRSNIFVGTESVLHRQEITKNVTSVLFLDFDSVLFLPSMNSFNRALVLVNRAMRLLRNSEHKKTLMICTRTPNHEVIQDITVHDFISNQKRDLQLREDLRLAPIFATAEIKTDKKTSDQLLESIDKSIVAGKRQQGEFELVMLKAKNHVELTQKAYFQVRKAGARARLSISVDQYD